MLFLKLLGYEGELKMANLTLDFVIGHQPKPASLITLIMVHQVEEQRVQKIQVTTAEVQMTLLSAHVRIKHTTLIMGHFLMVALKLTLEIYQVL